MGLVFNWLCLPSISASCCTWDCCNHFTRSPSHMNHKHLVAGSSCPCRTCGKSRFMAEAHDELWGCTGSSLSSQSLEHSELEKLQIGAAWCSIPAFMSSAGEGTAWFPKIYDVGSFEKMFLCNFFFFKQFPNACQC